jgi:uncharacterized protein HemX
MTDEQIPPCPRPRNQIPEEVDADPDEDPVEAPVEQAAKNIARNPLTIVALVVAVLGGGTGGLSLLQGQAAAADVFDAQDCREMIAAHAADVAKTRAAEWTAHRREEDSRYARQTDVVQISTKLDLVMEMVQEVRDEIRDNRRRRPAQ